MGLRLRVDDQFADQAEIWLDGENVTGQHLITEAVEGPSGYITFYVRDAAGRVVNDPDDGPNTDSKYGNVEIRFPMSSMRALATAFALGDD